MIRELIPRDSLENKIRIAIDEELAINPNIEYEELAKKLGYDPYNNIFCNAYHSVKQTREARIG